MEKFAAFCLTVFMIVIGTYIVVMETVRLLQTSLTADLVLVGIIGGTIYWHREAILRFWYGLTPHPAKHTVDLAIRSGEPIDGVLYAELTEPSLGNEIEAAVRADQAVKLAERLQTHEAAIRASEAREMEQLRRQMERENDVRRAHLKLVNAGVSHEAAAARLSAVRDEGASR